MSSLPRGSRRSVRAMALAALAGLCSCERGAEQDRSLGRIHISDAHRTLPPSAAAREPQTVEYLVENRRGDPLRIEKLQLSCACLDARIDRDVIPPWESATVTLELSRMSPGEQQASVTLVTDAEGQRPPVLSAEWEVLTPVTPDVPILELGSVLPDSTVERELSLTKPVPGSTVTAVTSQSPHLQIVDWHQDEQSGVVRLRLNAPGDCGPGQAVVQIDTPAASPESLTVPVLWEVRKAVEAVPQRLFLGSTDSGRPLRGTIVTNDYQGRECRLERVVVEDAADAVSADFRIDPSGIAMIDVTAGTEGLESGVHQTLLRVHVAAPIRESIEVPVSWVAGQLRSEP